MMYYVGNHDDVLRSRKIEVIKVKVKKISLSQRFDDWITRVGLVLFDGKSVCPKETTWNNK